MLVLVCVFDTVAVVEGPTDVWFVVVEVCGFVVVLALVGMVVLRVDGILDPVVNNRFSVVRVVS